MSDGTTEEKLNAEAETEEDLPVSRARPKRNNRPRPGKKGRRRSRTIATKKLSREELAAAEELRHFKVDRPMSRSLCVSGARPCPYVACKHHLYLDVNPKLKPLKMIL